MCQRVVDLNMIGHRIGGVRRGWRAAAADEKSEHQGAKTCEIFPLHRQSELIGVRPLNQWLPDWNQKAQSGPLTA
jgi:acetate kinase